jgi:hypothetical protein
MGLVFALVLVVVALVVAAVAMQVMVDFAMSVVANDVCAVMAVVPLDEEALVAVGGGTMELTVIKAFA